MSIQPSSSGQFSALPAKASFEIDLNRFRSEAGTQDVYKVAESDANLALENPTENIFRILPEYVATEGLRFVLGEANADTNEIKGHLETRGGSISYALDHVESPRDEDGNRYPNSRVIDETKLRIKYPSPFKRRMMRMLGREAMAKVRFERTDGVAVDFMRNIFDMTDNTDVSELNELHQMSIDDPEYNKIYARNVLINELRQDWNPTSQKFKTGDEVKEADLDFVPVVPDKSWVNDVYRFLRENDNNDPLAILRRDWDDETQSFKSETEQREVFSRLSKEMDKPSAELFVHGHEALAQLASEMDPVTVNEFNRLKSNDKFVQNQKSDRRDDDDFDDLAVLL